MQQPGYGIVVETIPPIGGSNSIPQVGRSVNSVNFPDGKINFVNTFGGAHPITMQASCVGSPIFLERVMMEFIGFVAGYLTVSLIILIFVELTS